MEGILYKWTNYLSGWQPRWFLLCGGILSYYDSREDACKGCKGSIQMAVCEIQDFSDNTEALKTKMSELRLYCDILVQQVNKTKETSTINTSDSQDKIDMGALLKSTCNTFLKTLEECMQIANNTFTSDLIHATPPGSPHLSVLRPSKARRSILSVHVSAQRKMELNNNLENGSVKEEANHDGRSFIEHVHTLSVEIPESVPAAASQNEHSKDLEGNEGASDATLQDTDSTAANDGAHTSVVTSTLQQDEGGGGEDEGGGGGAEERIQTFFSTMTHRFSDITFEGKDGIPTAFFLDSCYAVVPVLDKLGSTVFAPVKMDFVGNIKKINQKYITSKDEFTTLQKIVLHEVNSNMAQVRNSATEALLWLKRGLKFLHEFLAEVRNGENNIQTALSIAYGRTLRQYHGWVVRGVFALALRASPTYEGFVAALAVEAGDEKKDSFLDAMHSDLDVYLSAMKNQLNILDTLYEEHGLESDEVV
ncbi:hypothetical protein FKM82_006777 [Ascaphus truei]